MISYLKKQLLLSKWRRRRKRGRTINLRISDVPKVLSTMESRGVKNLVLRWFDEVPLTEQEKAAFKSSDDVDLLVDTTKLDLLAESACCFSGPIKCELYNVTGRRGMSFLDMPCYPPVLAREMLEHRELYREWFYVPDPLRHFRSLAYHLVYHKGVDCGVPTGFDIESEASPKRDYLGFLKSLGESLGIEIAGGYTLLNLHNYLKACDWDMPYDLLERWPVKSELHRALLGYELEILEAGAGLLPELLVFFVREDMIELGQVEAIDAMLSEKFVILDHIDLDDEQVTRVSRKVRGGNWLKYKGDSVVPPKKAVICYDLHPEAIRDEDSDKAELYQLVRNRNVFHKHTIRKRLQDSIGAKRQVIGIHGSDNAYEAQHMLRAIYGDDGIDEVNRQLKDILASKG